MAQPGIANPAACIHAYSRHCARPPPPAHPLPLQRPALLRVLSFARTHPRRSRPHILPQALRLGSRFRVFPLLRPCTRLRLLPGTERGLKVASELKVSRDPKATKTQLPSTAPASRGVVSRLTLMAFDLYLAQFASSNELEHASGTDVPYVDTSISESVANTTGFWLVEIDTAFKIHPVQLQASATLCMK